MLLRNITTAVIITLGCMAFGVWHERDSGKAGDRTFWRLSHTREFKSEVRNPTLFYNAGYPPNESFS